MHRSPAPADLLEFGVRVQNARDVAQLRWLIERADATLIRLTAAHMSTRRAPRPHQVIAELGLERRTRPRDEPATLQRLRAHDRRRELGWYPPRGASARAPAAADRAR